MRRILVRIANFAIFALAIVAIVPAKAGAFSLSPAGTEDSREIAKLENGFYGSVSADIARLLINMFSDPVHEEITTRIWGCDDSRSKGDETCLRQRLAPPAVLYGIQWNDNPPFKLDKQSPGGTCIINRPIQLPDRQPDCWARLFSDAKKNAAILAAKGQFYNQENVSALLYRTHFGDLQFLHAMASTDNETMAETKSRIMMWAEFSYRVSIGEISPETMLATIRIPKFSSFFGKYFGKGRSDVQTLFTWEVPQYATDISEVAFGTLLHMIEDSFSASHVDREPPVGTCGGGAASPRGGRVLQFFNYIDQNSDDHSREDAREAMLSRIRAYRDDNVVSVGRYVKAIYEQRKPWPVLKAYLDDCVFAIDPDDMNKTAKR